MISQRPMRVVIPAVLLAIGLVLTAVQFLVDVRSRQQDIELDFAERVASLGNRAVSVIENSLARGARDSALLQVALLVSEPGLQLALLADQDLKTLQATRGEYRGGTLRELRDDGLVTLLDQARSTSSAQYRLSPDGRRYEAALPVQLNLQPGELRSSRVGALYLAFDLSDARAVGRAQALRHAAEMAVAVFGLCLLASWFLHRVISRRTAQLLDAVNRIAGGDANVRANVVGGDELAGLAAGINEMAARLERRDVDLSEANEELRESEQRFRQVVENIHEVFWIHDPVSGSLVYVSAAYARIWGRSSESLYANPMAWIDAIHEEDRQRVRRAFETQQLRGRYDEVYRILRPDSSVRWIRDRGYLVRNDGGAVYRIVGVAEDITERRELEIHIQQSQKLEAVGRLAGGIAHDFNNLIAAILGNARLAQEDVGASHPAAESVKEILRAGERARSLVQQILIFNRGLPQARQVVDLAQIVQEAVGQARAALPPGAQLEARIASDLPHVVAHATRLHQVVMNLLTNAGLALDGKPGRIEVDVEQFDVDAALARRFVGLSQGLAVRLSVRDTGRGMDQATLARIFEPFFTTREVGRGTGLGLALAYSIVQEHQGAIDVRSEPGKGSTFAVYLPATRLPVSETKAKAEAPEAGHGERIVYLDDDEALVSLITRSLRRLGYQVTGFKDQEEALRHLQADPSAADIFVTDYNMPGLSGLDVAQKVLQIRPEMPVLLMSGYVTETLVRGARQLGVLQVLEKPGDVVALTDAIHATLSEA